MIRRLSSALFVLAAFLTGFGLQAQEAGSWAAPKTDGVLSAGEYRYEKTASGITLGVTLSPDGKTLFVAVRAPTAGWVAAGIGSLKMNGAFMVIAYDANGAPTVSEQTGKGHGHSPNATNKLAASAVRESDGVTTLELVVPAAGYTEGNAIKLIAAYGKADNLTSMHRGFLSAEAPLSAAR